MRSAFLIFCVLLFGIQTQAQTYGMADEFTYDGSGNRVKREYKWTIIAPKQGDHGEHPVDTFKQAFQKTTLVVRVYPNPTSNEMIVENLDWKDGTPVTVKIFDIAGKLLHERAFSNAKESFSLAGFAPGVYQVQYYLDNKQLTTWKIVKQ